MQFFLPDCPVHPKGKMLQKYLHADFHLYSKTIFLSGSQTNLWYNPVIHEQNLKIHDSNHSNEEPPLINPNGFPRSRAQMRAELRFV